MKAQLSASTYFYPQQSKVYLSGPMSGRPGFNYAQFNEAARRLRDAGLAVFNPAEHEIVEIKPMEWENTRVSEATRNAFMVVDFQAVIECDWVVALPDWDTSRGALAELFVGFETGKRLLEIELIGSNAYSLKDIRYTFSVRVTR